MVTINFKRNVIFPQTFLRKKKVLLIFFFLRYSQPNVNVTLKFPERLLTKNLKTRHSFRRKKYRSEYS